MYDFEIANDNGTIRERLIHMLCNVDCNGADRREGGVPSDKTAVAMSFKSWICVWFETIADHLLANGVIVPPCKVGDTVYSIMYGHNIIECKVAQITIEPHASIGMSFRCYGGMTFDMRHWGKTVFSHPL